MAAPLAMIIPTDIRQMTFCFGGSLCRLSLSGKPESFLCNPDNSRVQSIHVGSCPVGPALDALVASFTMPTLASRLEGGYRFGTAYAGFTPYAAVQAQTAFLPSYIETATFGTGATANAVASRVQRRYEAISAPGQIRG